MKITAQQIMGDEDMSIACVPVGQGSAMPLSDDEKETIKLFPDLEIEAEGNALPLHIYLLGGSSKRFYIYPAPGGNIVLEDGMLPMEKDGCEICVFPEPFRG